MQLTHRQVSWVLGFSLTVVTVPVSGLALTVQEVPNPRQANSGWVTDMANILSPSIEAQLNQMVAELEAKNGVELAIVTVARTTPEHSPKEFATELFNYWGIGKKGQDNGVLLLISQGDRRVEIETGYGVEAILPDAKVGRIISEEITPKFKQGNFDGGTLAGTQSLVKALDIAPPPANLASTSAQALIQPVTASETPESQGLPRYFWWIGGLGLVGGCFGITRWLKRMNNQQGSSRKAQRDRQPLHRETDPVPDPQPHIYQRSSYSSSSPNNDGDYSWSGRSTRSSSQETKTDPVDEYSWSGRDTSYSYSSDSSYSSSSSDTSSSYSSDSSSSSSSSSDTSSSYSSSDSGGGSSGGGGAGDSW